MWPLTRDELRHRLEELELGGPESVADACLGWSRWLSCDWPRLPAIQDCGQAAVDLGEPLLEELVARADRLRFETDGVLEVTMLVEAQDLRCLLELTVTHWGEIGKILARHRKPLEHAIDVLSHAAVAMSDAESASRFFDEFPIRDRWRLPALVTPFTTLDLEVASIAVPAPPAASASWKSAAESPADLSTLSAASRPAGILMNWFEQLDELHRLHGGIVLRISRRLDDRWQVQVDILCSDAPLRATKVAVGGLAAEPADDSGQHWVRDLSKLPPAVRAKVLRGSCLIELESGELVRIS